MAKLQNGGILNGAEARQVSGRKKKAPVLDEGAQAEMNWNQLLAMPGTRFEPFGSDMHMLLIRDPGPGEIFKFEELLKDQGVRDNNPKATVDICRAHAGCLYLTILNLDDAKRLLWRHRLLTVPV